MTALFENLSQANSFLIITLLLFCDWYAPTLSIWSDYQNFKKWHMKSTKEMWLPGVLFFPIIIVILYILLDISFFAFYKNAFLYIPSSDRNWVIPVVTFMILFNIMLTKQWIANHIGGTRRLLSYFLLLGMIVTALVYLGLTGYYDRWLEFGTYVPYLVFWLGALYLTIYGSYLEKLHKKKEKNNSMDLLMKQTMHSS